MDTKHSTKSELAITTVRIPRTDLERLRDLAESEHRTLSQEMRRMIEARLAEAELEEAA